MQPDNATKVPESPKQRLQDALARLKLRQKKRQRMSLNSSAKNLVTHSKTSDREQRREAKGARKGAAPPTRRENPKSDSWCFTWQSPPTEDIHPVTEWPRCRYAVWQLETCPTTQRPHYQGYVQFDCKKELSALKRIDQRIHWEPANGSDEHNHHYCTKPHEGCGCKHCKDCPPRLSGPWEEGEREARLRGKSGARTDLHRVTERVKEGATMRELADEHPEAVIRYHRGLEKLVELQAKPREKDPNNPVVVHWLYGPSSTGKTTRANEIARAANLGPMYRAATPKANGLRWNGYNYEKVVFIDDFTANYMQYSELLRMLSDDSWQCPTDGSSKEFQAKLIIIASILHPQLHYQKLYLAQNRTWDELCRRITFLHHMTEVHEMGYRGGHHAPAPPEEYYGTATYQKFQRQTQYGVPQVDRDQ